MHRIIAAAFVTFLSACVSPPAPPDPRAVARELAQMEADRQVNTLLDSIRGQMSIEIDCSQETGDDARQCEAFLARIKPETEALLAREFASARTTLAAPVSDLASAIATLSADDTAILREIVQTPVGEKPPRPMSAEGWGMIETELEALWTALQPIDESLGDKAAQLQMRILLDLMREEANR